MKKQFWERFKEGWAYALMSRYQHRLDIVNDAGEVLCIVWSIDKRTHDRNFTVKPRYHAIDAAQETVN